MFLEWSPLETMLRIHCMQLFYKLSDPVMEDTLCETEPMHRFAGLRLSDALPDESTILNVVLFDTRTLLVPHQGAFFKCPG